MRMLLQLMVCCPWMNEETKLRIVFAPPFRSSYKLNTVGSRKFLQVTLHGLTSSNFIVSNHQLSIQGQLSQDIPIVPLNPRSQELVRINGYSSDLLSRDLNTLFTSTGFGESFERFVHVGGWSRALRWRNPNPTRILSHIQFTRANAAAESRALQVLHLLATIQGNCHLGVLKFRYFQLICLCRRNTKSTLGWNPTKEQNSAEWVTCAPW